MKFWNRWFEDKRDRDFRIHRAIVSAEAAGFSRGVEWARYMAEHGQPPPESRIERIQRMETEGMCSPRSAAHSIANMFLKE